MFECVINQFDMCRSARPLRALLPLRPLRLLPLPVKNDINALEKQLFDLQKLLREAQKAKIAEETSQAEAEPTSEPGAGPLEVSTSLYVFCKRTSYSRHVVGSG